MEPMGVEGPWALGREGGQQVPRRPHCAAMGPNWPPLALSSHCRHPWPHTGTLLGPHWAPTGPPLGLICHRMHLLPNWPRLGRGVTDHPPSGGAIGTPGGSRVCFHAPICITLLSRVDIGPRPQGARATVGFSGCFVRTAFQRTFCL